MKSESMNWGGSQQEQTEETEKRFFPLSSLLPPVPRLLFALLLLAVSMHAEVAPVSIRVPEPKAWTGQRLPFFVDLRARGSFGDAASFSLPRIPGSVVIKIGNPVVSSEQIEGESWFVQSHEFALFSQRTGVVEIPSFEVRFGARDGFVGPVKDIVAEVPAARVAIQRPPGSESNGFLITTDSLEIKETWEPAPGRVEVGAVFKRTIAQRADQLTGMALAPAPTTAPKGVRVYPASPEVSDNTERGAFIGERSETLTYLIEQPGTHTLPEIRYVWWDPESGQLRSKTLPAVVIEATAPPTSVAGTSTPPPPWAWLLAGMLLVAASAWQGRRISLMVQRLWRLMNPPDQVAARRLLRACRANDATLANAAWRAWCATQPAALSPGPSLQAAIVMMQRAVFGPRSPDSWCGQELASEFSAHLALGRDHTPGERASALPLLNGQARDDGHLERQFLAG